MPFWVKGFLLLYSGLIFWLIPSSLAIPFVYENKIFLVAFLSFLSLAGTLCLFEFINFKLNPNFKPDKSVNRYTFKKTLIRCLAIFIVPPLAGDMLSSLTPITADFFASEFQIHEYKAVKAESYAKSFRHLSKVYVVDVYNNSTEFVLENEMLNQLNLHEGDKLVVTGRNCIAGFVIDKINGIERK